MNKLFSDITIEPFFFEDNTYPLLRIKDKIEITYIDANHTGRDTLDVDDEYVLLEKYEVDRNNANQTANVQNLLYYQNALEYMTSYNDYTIYDPSDEQYEKTKWGNLYISGNYIMGGFDVGIRPENISIEKFFAQGMPDYIIDTDTDSENYIYCYRIIARISGIEYFSKYVAGVQTLEIEDFSIDKESELSIFKGNGTIYRDGLDGKVFKSLHFDSFNPRYRGPIEKEKVNSTYETLENNLNYIERYIDLFNDKLDSRFDKIVEIGC